MKTKEGNGLPTRLRPQPEEPGDHGGAACGAVGWIVQLSVTASWPSRSKRQIFYGKEALGETLLMSPIRYSFQEQEDTRAIPREGRHQVGHLLASVPAPARFSPL
jgi:hypothetical protein